MLGIQTGEKIKFAGRITKGFKKGFLSLPPVFSQIYKNMRIFIILCCVAKREWKTVVFKREKKNHYFDEMMNCLKDLNEVGT